MNHMYKSYTNLNAEQRFKKFMGNTQLHQHLLSDDGGQQERRLSPVEMFDANSVQQNKEFRGRVSSAHTNAANNQGKPAKQYLALGISPYASNKTLLSNKNKISKS